jgi:DtxR family Mn-dependent transcriptional regulator
MIGGTHHDLSVAMQDYLKILYRLEQDGERLTNSAVATALRLSAASVSTMMKKLAERGCIAYAPYQEMQLTHRGRSVALELIRHHRIIEAFLVKVLGMRWDEVHEEAERLEHVISEKLEARMAAMLDDPLVDPHGHPIPGPAGDVQRRTDLVALLALDPGEAATVVEVSDRDPAALRYLERQGVVPGTRLRLVVVHPFEGPFECELLTRVPALEHATMEQSQRSLLSRPLAAMLLVRRVTTQSESPIPTDCC